MHIYVCICSMIFNFHNYIYRLTQLQHTLVHWTLVIPVIFGMVYSLATLAALQKVLSIIICGLIHGIASRIKINGYFSLSGSIYLVTTMTILAVLFREVNRT